MEEQCGWDFQSTNNGDSITVISTPKEAGQSPVRFIYTGVSDPAKRCITLYTQIRTLDASDRFLSWEDTFSYKASVKISDVYPWVAEKRQSHGSRVKSFGIKSVIGELSLTYGLPIVWNGIRDGLADIHEAKSRAKDRKSDAPSELF